MRELIQQIEEKIAEAKKEPVSAFRDVAIGGMLSAIHGLRVAEENLKWHQEKRAAMGKTDQSAKK